MTSSGFGWFKALIVMFVLGVVYILFNQVVTINLRPVTQGLINDSVGDTINQSVADDLTAEGDKAMAFLHIIPFIIFFIVILYIIVVWIRAGKTNE